MARFPSTLPATNTPAAQAKFFHRTSRPRSLRAWLCSRSRSLIVLTCSSSIPGVAGHLKSESPRRSEASCTGVMASATRSTVRSDSSRRDWMSMPACGFRLPAQASLYASSRPQRA